MLQDYYINIFILIFLIKQMVTYEDNSFKLVGILLIKLKISSVKFI